MVLTNLFENIFGAKDDEQVDVGYKMTVKHKGPDGEVKNKQSFKN